MKCKWKECTLGDLITFQRGHDLPKSQMTGGKYPVVGSNGIIGYHNEYTTEYPSITIGRSGNVGNPFIVYGRTWSHNTTLYVKDFKSNDPVFVFYFLKTMDLAKYACGSAVPTLNRNHIHTLLIKVPESVEIQKKIGYYLRLLDEKIELNNAINNNLEQQVSILYQSWFEDFEITNGVCPEDWSYQELSSIADIASGKRPPVKSNVCNQETPISIVGAASVMGFTSEANHTDKILVTGRVGTHGVVQRFNTPCWTSDNTLVITSPYYEFTNQILHRIDYSSMNRGSTQPLITQGDMKKVVVLVPDENTLAKFEEFAGSLMVKWEANNKENVKLASLRDTILPKLMSGELDVSNIKI